MKLTDELRSVARGLPVMAYGDLAENRAPHLMMKAAHELERLEAGVRAWGVWAYRDNDGEWWGRDGHIFFTNNRGVAEAQARSRTVSYSWPQGFKFEARELGVDGLPMPKAP